MRKKILTTIHRLIRRVQQRNKFVDTKASSGISLLETHLLIELQASGGSMLLKDVQQLLQLEQSTLSKITSQLELDGLLKKKNNPEHASSRCLYLTKKAARTIAVIDQEANAYVQKFSSKLSSQDFEDLTEFVEIIADFFEQPQRPMRASDTRFRVAQRRITRALHLLGSDVLESSLSTIEWHVLSEVVLSGNTPVQIVELSELISVPQNSLTNTIKNLEMKELLLREKSPVDKRVTHLFSTASGKSLYKKIEANAVKHLSQCFKRTTETKLQNYLSLLIRYSSDSDGTRPPLLPGYSVEGVKKTDLSMARGLAARIAVEAGVEEQIPANFLIEENSVFILKYNGNPCGVYEIAPGDTPDILYSCTTQRISEWARQSVRNYLQLLF